MEKRGQVSPFIIIAIIILVVIILVLISQKNLNFFQSSPTHSIENNIMECAAATTRNSIEVIGIQGGYYLTKPKFYLDFETMFIPVYYAEGEYSMPTKQTIETELASYVDLNLADCLSSIKNERYSLNYSTSKTIAQIKDNEVEFNIKFPVKITKETQTTLFDLNDKPIIHPVALDDIYEVAEYITESHRENSEEICADCLLEKTIEKDVYVNFFDYGDNSVLVVISENRTTEEVYAFEFLNKYINTENENK